MSKILVCGAGGFIGGHLVEDLVNNGHDVIGVDIKFPQFRTSAAQHFIKGDLRDPDFVSSIITADIDEVYQLAADMGGAGYLFSGENDANVMHNSALINLNVVDAVAKRGISKILYTSSACVYNTDKQNAGQSQCVESEVYPANPDHDYGFEKLFSERLYLAYARNYGLRVRIARLHNIFGPYGSWNDGREKAPAAVCRKVAEATSVIDVWGDGTQRRSFLFVPECVEGLQRIMAGNYDQPLNLGSEEMISINQLVEIVTTYAGKKLTINHIPGPLGVLGRTSHNGLIKHQLGWQPSERLREGLQVTYDWIKSQLT